MQAAYELPQGPREGPHCIRAGDASRLTAVLLGSNCAQCASRLRIVSRTPCRSRSDVRHHHGLPNRQP